MRPAVLIPCHSRLDLLERTLDALSGQEVLVVDDSPDGLDMPDVSAIRTAGEQGFARAVNQGLAQLEAEGFSHVLVLNDDAIPMPGCVDALISAFTEGDGAVGPLLVSPDGELSCGFIVRSSGRVRVRHGRVDEATEVDAISGAAMLIRSSERFDEGYQHGFEDLELCRRLREQGLAVRTIPVICQHIGGATISQKSRQAQRAAVSGHLRYLGGGWRGGLAMVLSAGQVIREGGSPARMLGVLDGWRDYRRAHCSSVMS